MAICKKRDKSFDVLTKNKITNMTSVEWATQLVDESEVKRRKGWPTTDKKRSSEEHLPSCKTVHKNIHSDCYHLFWIIKALNKFCILNYHHVLVLLLMLRS